MLWIKSGIENPSKSEVIGHCGGDEKIEWPRRTDKSQTLKKQKNYTKRSQKTENFYWFLNGACENSYDFFFDYLICYRSSG